MSSYKDIIANPATAPLITDELAAYDMGKRAGIEEANELAVYAMRLDVKVRVQFARGVYEACAQVAVTDAWGEVCCDPAFIRAMQEAFGDRPHKPMPVIARLNAQWAARS